MKKIMEIENLKKSYYTNSGEIIAIEDFSFSFEEGKFITIVGPSGCGKSTLLSIIANLEEKTSGNITKGNEKIGYMFQQDALFSWRTVLNNCLISLEINNNKNIKTKEKVINLLKKYGLEDFIYKYPNELSGGMRQRVALIRTLVSNPDILLLDEPFSALDYQTRLSLSDDIYKIIKDEGKTAIMVTHDIAEAISLSDIIIIMSNRPSKIKKIIEINLTNRSTPINNRKCNEFNYYYDLIWKEIDHHEL